MELTNKQITVIFKALCDENRVQIFRLLQNGEKCACKLLEAMQCTQPTLSHDMKLLIDAGIVKSRREGQRILYSLNIDSLQMMQAVMQKMLREDDHPA